MGNGQSAVEVLADQASLYLPPPCKCVLTAPFPDDVTYDKFWDALVSTFKSDFKFHPNYKDGKLVELGDDHFVTYSVLAGAEGRDNAIGIVYRTDKSEGTIYEESRVPVLDVLLAVGVTKVHRDPLRVEYWRQPVHLERRSGPKASAYAAGLLKVVLDRDVEVQIDQESPSEPNFRSAVSVPLDDFTTADALWEGLLDAVKVKGQPGTLLSTVDEKTEGENKRATRIRIGLSEEAAQALNMKEVQTTVVELPTIRTMCIKTDTPQHCLMEVVYLRINTEPLRVECFRFDPATFPLGNEEHRVIVDQVVTRSIQKAQEG